MTTSAATAARLGQEPYEPPAAQTPTARSSLAAAMTRWIAIALAFAVTLELTCRVEDWLMYRMPIASRYTSLNDLTIRDADGMHGRPNARFEKWVMNSMGMRGPETTLVPGPGTLRVFVVGASESFGLRESPGREYPRQLEDSLAARVARGECDGERGVKFEVLNAAFAGMGIPTTDQDVRNRLRRMRPDFIFVYPSPAQYLDAEVPFAALPDSAARPGPPPLSHAFRPRATARLREQIKLLLPEWLKKSIRTLEKREAVRAQPDHWQFTTVPQERVDRFDSDLRHLIGTVRGIGAEPVLATHANLFMGRTTRDAYALVAWEKFYPRATGETIIAFDSVARVAMIRVARDSNVVSVDAAQRLAAAPPSAFGDFVHFTDLGSSHMADVASQGLIQSARRAGRCHVATGAGESRSEPARSFPENH
jgi:hypothetical protein